ncbi:MAG: DUF4159 domain-containing protein [Alphaproteobacteria bacterium]|nr:DUF4159 domain-containing protein [Alphaproteobacteria bacterium]MDA8004824.1 DUF4159 domain-containing protein [Alphaproteobacteria bacterium]MDA8006538.1 DUF4159 domain-containing protein [Alphaproteobacteria bacterium]MDA8013941.1 DUF4159 domain-containing protein [Alphaproteobacteria bacterium]
MPLVFELPWLLLALAGLPALWWLLRVTPPPLKRIDFPAVKLLIGLRDSEDKPHRIPLWLLILRILAATLLIIALAGPRFEPEPLLSGNGTLLLAIDNGWSAAPVWQDFTAEWETIIRAAQRQGRAVHILPTAQTTAAEPQPPELSSAGEALRRLERLRPVSWPSDYTAAAARLRNLDQSMDEIVFLSDGLGGRDARRFITALRRLGDVSLRLPPSARRARLLQPPIIRADSLHLATIAAPETVPDLAPEVLQMRGANGELLASESTGDYNSDGLAETRLRLPRRILDQLAAVETANSESAGGVQLLAEGDRLRRVLLWLPPAEINEPQPLLSSAHYLTRALSLFAEVKRGKLELLETFAPDIIVTDGENTLADSEAAILRRWVGDGGILLRFAGNGLLAETATTLLPVRLRPAVRSLGGALSWEEPVSISPDLPENSPLVGLAIPGDLRVSRAVLAEPGPELEQRAWLWLQDGAPLLTAAEQGDGVVILVHTAANAEWSNIPISGYFVQLLQRLSELARISAASDIAGGDGGQLEPFLVLDGFGRLTSPARDDIAPISLQGLAALSPSARHPPGLYGSEDNRLAFNLGGRISPPRVLEAPSGVRRGVLGEQNSLDLRPHLLLAVLFLAFVEFWAGLWLRGLLWPLQSLRAFGGTKNVGTKNVGTTTGVVIAAVTAVALTSGANETAEAQAPEIVLQETRIVYAITGHRETDETSFNALRALTNVTATRTSVHLSEPFGVRPGVDDLSPYPLIYWPYELRAPLPDSDAREALREYLLRGGMVLIDLRRTQFLGDDALGDAEEQFLEALRLPPLAPVPQDYVLHRSFYLLTGTPGRYNSPLLWMSAPDPGADNVSPLFVGVNDWSAAWALDDFGNPEYALIPGGGEQREAAYRFGVNLILHALSGSYKADQIHLEAIINRLQR